MSKFRYDLLPDSEDHIRLLKITSSSLAGPVHCTLAPFRLDSAPRYAAVSYTWGEPGLDMHEIIVNGEVFKVQKNLYDFLRVLQKWRESRELWIDAVCIDQHQLRERNHQVRLMNTIYTKAVEVLIWLGPATDTSDEAMGLLQSLGGSPVSTDQMEPVVDKRTDNHTRRKWWHLPVPAFSRRKNKSNSPLQVPTAASSNPDFRTWSFVAELCRCEYWKRVWILQEVALAQHITIFCGSKQVPEAAFMQAFSVRDNNYWENAKMTRTYNGPASPNTTIMNLQYSNAADVLSLSGRRERRTLLDLLFQYQDSRCHDARDHVFALLSLASDCSAESTMRADYAWDSERLFFEVMAFCHPRNTTQSAAMLQNLLGIERGRPPRDLARKLLGERESSTSTPFRTVPIWVTYKDLLGPQKLSGVLGRSIPSHVKCFKYLFKEPKRFTTIDDDSLYADTSQLAWFTQAKVTSGDRVYSLPGCPLAFIYRAISARLVFMGLAVLRNYDQCEAACQILHELHPPVDLPGLEMHDVEKEGLLASILVDYHTLVQAVVLSYLPTEPGYIKWS